MCPGAGHRALRGPRNSCTPLLRISAAFCLDSDRRGPIRSWADFSTSRATHASCSLVTSRVGVCHCNSGPCARMRPEIADLVELLARSVYRRWRAGELSARRRTCAGEPPTCQCKTRHLPRAAAWTRSVNIAFSSISGSPACGIVRHCLNSARSQSAPRTSSPPAHPGAHPGGHLHLHRRLPSIPSAKNPAPAIQRANL